jgi:hypothetical protein
LLREGKTSIAKVYSELVAPEQSPKRENADVINQRLVSDPILEQNRIAIMAILASLHGKKLFCHSCGNEMFECSRCKKSLKEMLRVDFSEKNT